MKRSKEEAEVIIRIDYQDSKAYICVSQWPSMAAKMKKRYGQSLDSNGKFSARWVVPLKAISFRSGVALLTSEARTKRGFSRRYPKWRLRGKTPQLKP